VLQLCATVAHERSIEAPLAVAAAASLISARTTDGAEDGAEWREVTRSSRSSKSGASVTREAEPRPTTKATAQLKAERAANTSSAVPTSGAAAEPRAAETDAASVAGAHGAISWQQRLRTEALTGTCAKSHETSPARQCVSPRTAEDRSGNADREADVERLSGCTCAELAEALRMLHPRAASELALTWRNMYVAVERAQASSIGALEALHIYSHGPPHAH
jgi:hypothetical protein